MPQPMKNNVANSRIKISLGPACTHRRHARLNALWTVAILVSSLLPQAVSAQTILKASPFGPPGHLLNKKILQGWAESVGVATEGRVKVEVLPAAVAPPPGILEAIKNGQADVSLLSNGALKTKLVLNVMVEFAGQTPNSETASVAYQRVVERYPALADEFGDVQLLGGFTHGPGVLLLSRSGAAGKADFSALTINAGGGGGAAVVQDLGAKPMMSAHPPKAEVLADGQADGTITTIDSYTGFGLSDVVKAVVTTPNGFYTAGFAMVANSAKWRSLDARDKAAIVKVSGPVLSRLAGKAWDEGDSVALQKVREAGVPVSSLSIGQQTRFAAAGEQRKKAWLNALGAGAGQAESALADYKKETSTR